jgi:acyl-[acyl-carrier-protein]-phospholipid O-acyltransferase/long-chain-fatty-acid--[acyl-carrier-protein] ligase
MPTSTRAPLLTSRRLWPLCVSQVCGAFDDNLLKSAIVALAAFKLGNAGAGFAAMAGALFIAPYLLLSATGGQIADRFAKGRVILWVKAAEIPLMLCAAVGFLTGNLEMLLATLFGIGVQAALFGPLKYGLLPEHLREDELVGGNGIIEATTFLAILAGTVGGTASMLPHGGLIVSIAGLVSASIGLAAAYAIPPTQAADPQARIGWNIVGATMGVIGEARANMRVWRAILGLSWFWTMGATVIAEFPALARDSMGAGGQVVALLLGAFAVGIGGGSWLSARLLAGQVSARHVPWAALGMTAFCFDLGHCLAGGAPIGDAHALLTTAHGLRVLADLLALAACGGVFSVPLNAILQDAAPRRSRARTIAANNAVNAAFIIVAAGVVALVSALGLSAPHALEWLGFFNLAVAALLIRAMPQALVRPVFAAYFRVFHRVQVTGLQNYIDAGDRVVIVSNHLSYLDALLISTILPDSPSFAIHTHQARRLLVRLVSLTVRIFAIDVSNPYAIRRMIEAVRDHGDKLMVFPEGRISQTGAMMKIYEGAGLVADRAGAKIVPIHIDGTQFTPFSHMRGKLRLRWFPRLRVSIFPAVDVTPARADALSPRERRVAAGRALEDLMVRTDFAARDIDRTLMAAFLDARATHGKRALIVEDIARNPLSYDRVLLGAAALGDKLIAGTGMGERVGLMLPNANATLVALLGLSAFGRVPAMLNFSAGAVGMLSACRAACVTKVVTSRAFVEKARLGAVVARLAADLCVIYLEDVRPTITLGDKLRAKWRSMTPHRLPGVAQDCNGPAVVLFTSGSEGTPKGVVLSHRNILANCGQLGAIIDFNPSDRVFAALPMFHAFGLIGATLLPVFAGVRIFLYPSPLHYRIVPALIYDTDATICFGTDTFLNGWARYANPYDFYRVRYMFAGAERVRESTKSLYAERFGVRVLEGYGTTETSPALAMNTAMHTRTGSVGRILPGVEHRIEPVPGIEEGGKLCVRGPNVMLGYLRVSAPGVLEPPADGWYDTGDIVRLDDRGFLAITGRVKRFAKIAGEMISMTGAETLVAALWPNDQHAVLAVPDARRGEALLLLTTRPGAAVGDIVEFARGQGAAEISVPRAILHVAALPLLGTGKIDYPAAQRLAEARRPGAAEHAEAA